MPDSKRLRRTEALTEREVDGKTGKVLLAAILAVAVLERIQIHRVADVVPNFSDRIGWDQGTFRSSFIDANGYSHGSSPRAVRSIRLRRSKIALLVTRGAPRPTGAVPMNYANPYTYTDTNGYEHVITTATGSGDRSTRSASGNEAVERMLVGAGRGPVRSRDMELEQVKNKLLNRIATRPPRGSGCARPSPGWISPNSWPTRSSAPRALASRSIGRAVGSNRGVLNAVQDSLQLEEQDAYQWKLLGPLVCEDRSRTSSPCQLGRGPT